MKNTALYAWLTVNISFIGMTALTWHFELLQIVFMNDVSYITWAMAGIFPLVLLASMATAFKIVNDANNINGLRTNFIELSQKAHNSGDAREALFTRLTTRYAFHDFAISQYVVIGLIGTIIGVAMAFSNLPTGDAYSDPAAIQAIIGTLWNGLSVAFYTTLLGGVLSFWLSVNRFILHLYTSALFRKVLGDE